MSAPSVDPSERRKFESFAETWWDPQGPFWPLHRLNDFRANWLIQRMGTGGDRPLAGLRVLDIGCGGGLASEAMARAGAQVTGIDIVERSIEVARQHAQRSGLNIDYRCQAAEDLLATGVEPFDWVLNLEVVEHVNDLPNFLNTTAQLVKPGGYQVVATINRNPLSGLVAIFGAEYVLRLLPKGTHQYSKLVKPAELAQYLMDSGLSQLEFTGVQFNPFAKRASVTWHTWINYLCVSQRVARYG